MKPKRTFVWAGFGAALFLIALATGLAMAALRQLAPPIFQSILEMISDHILYILIPVALIIFAAIFLFEALFQRFIFPIYKLTEEISLINSANPSHRVSIRGNRPCRELAKTINQWADMYQTLENSVEDKISYSNEKLENERNILASVISELSEGIVICTAQGQTLLFNKRAKQFLESASGSSPEKKRSGLIGLGRPIFEVIDKNLIIHALEEIGEKMGKKASDITAAFMATGRDNELFRVETVPILKLKNRLSGFILVIYDMAAQLEKDKRLSALFQSFRRDIRASIASVRSAIEVILEYPEMDEQRLGRFSDIIKSEFKVINQKLDSEILEYSHLFHNQRKLVPMPAASLLASVKQKLKGKMEMVSEVNSRQECWIQIDTYTMILALLSIMDHVKNEIGIRAFHWVVEERGRFVNLDVFWRGSPVTIEKLRQWEERPLVFNDESILLTLNEIMGYHEGKIWPYSLKPGNEKAYLRIVLPLAKVPHRDASEGAPVFYEGRPEFYDFDLFNQPGQTRELGDIPLTRLNFTVFDTETTGLDPMGGDEIISIGAFRIVNSRILKTDYFDQLIDPRRPMSWESVKIHGIYPETLVGKPVICDVLPRFSQFVGETILIAHNAAFDMKMLQMKEKATGIKFINPTLDTMLLSIVIHPAQDQHNLEAIAERLGVCIVGRHTALGDALATGELFLKMIPLLEKMGIHTLKDAMTASKKTYYSRVDYFR